MELVLLVVKINKFQLFMPIEDECECPTPKVDERSFESDIRGASVEKMD